MFRLYNNSSLSDPSRTILLTMAHEFIATQRSAYSDLFDQYAQLESLFSQRLWHQLTEALLAFVSSPGNSRGDNFIQLYEHFISQFENRLNQLSLQQLVAKCAAQYYPTTPYIEPEVNRAIDMVSRQLEKRLKVGEDRLEDDAFLVVKMEITSLKIKKAIALAEVARGGDSAAVDALSALLDECKADLSEGKELLEKLSEGRDPRTTATYYRAASEYYKVRGPAHLFYESALMYLGNVPLESLFPEEQVSMAVDVAVAALVGDSVYNFGEVNGHPILASLQGTEHAWLIELLKTFQTGDIDAFNAVVASHRAAFTAQAALESSMPIIKEKITLLCVMELAAQKPAAARTISFDEIASATRLPLDQVEWVLMRAMSLGLLRGKIDEVDKVINVSFVKPRVLDKAQINDLKERVDAWREKAKSSLLFVEERTRDIFT